MLKSNYIYVVVICFFWLTDESGSDSDGAESTSSSYSSLSDYVVVIWGFFWLTDESGSDSDGAESTSSSYSSLSDYVTDMINSEIDGDTPGIVQISWIL